MLLEKRVVTCFLESDGEILILRRSGQVGTYQGRWAGVSGYIETTADEQALVEIKEEAGLSPEDLKLIKTLTRIVFERGIKGVRLVYCHYHPINAILQDTLYKEAHEKSRPTRLG